MSTPVIHKLDRRHRLAVAAAAGVASASVLAGVLVLFERAGPSHWLRGDAQVLELVARCDELPERAARERCTRDVVAVLVLRSKNEARLAAR